MSNLTSEDEIVLRQLNDAVSSTVATRTQWMDSKMSQYSKLQVGEEIWDILNGVRLGIVTELYRYHAGHPSFDTSMSIHVRYHVGGEVYDNTSRQQSLRWGSQEDALRELNL